MHSAYCAVTRYPSVCPSVTRRCSVETVKYIIIVVSPSGSHTVLVVPHQTVRQYSDGNPTNMDVKCKVGMRKIAIFDQYLARFISEMIQDRDIVTMEGEQETVPKISNGTSSMTLINL